MSQFDRKNGPKSGVGTKRLSSPSAPRPDTMDKISLNSPIIKIFFRLSPLEKVISQKFEWWLRLLPHTYFYEFPIMISEKKSFFVEWKECVM